MPSRKYKVVALSLGQGLSGLIGIVVAMIMARLLSKDDVAAYRQTLLAYATFGPILGLGIGQGMYYFLPGEKTRVRGRLLDGLSVAGLMGAVFAISLALGGNEFLAKRFSNPKVANMLLWMIPYAIISTPAKLASSVLVARDRVSVSAIFGVIRQFFIGISTIVPLVLWETAETALIGNVVASVLMGIAAITLMVQSTPPDSMYPSFAGSKELVLFTIPLALAGMLGTITMQMDKLIVSFICSPEEFAVYTLGAIEIPIIGIVTGAVTSVALADMRRSVVDGKKGEALKFFRKIGEKTALVIFPVMIFFLINAEQIIYYLYSSGYADSVFPFRYYLLLLPIRTVVFGSIIIALGKSKFILFRSFVGLIFNMALSVFFVWNFGGWGAAAATVLSIYLWALPANIFFISYQLNCKWYQVLPFKKYGEVIFALIPLTVISLAIREIVTDSNFEFFLIASCFLVFLAFYWNKRLYSLENLASRFAKP